MDEYTRRREAARSRWRIVGQVIAATWAFRSATREENPQISTGAANPLSSLSSSMTSPISRWRILKHVIVAVLKFQSALRRRHQASGSSHFPITDDWIDLGFSPISDFDLFQSPTGMQGLDPPSLSRWRLVKHVVVATLRMQSGRRRRTATSLPNLPDLELKAVIGKDESSGKIYTAVHRQTGQAYALKEIPCNSSQQQQIRREVEILKELDHPNLVKIYGILFADDSGVSYLLLESLHFGSPSVTSESEVASLARQLLLGLTYLHRKRITHGDIKPSNIFVDDSGQVKLLYSGETLSQTPPLPANIRGIHDGFTWDIWSVGLCILKWCKGLNWFDGDAGSVRHSRLMPVPAASGEKQPLSLDLSMWMDVGLHKDVVPSSSSSQGEGALVWKPSVGLLNLLSACMRTDVQEIQTAEKLVEHPFFFQLPMEKVQMEFQIARLEKDVQIPLKKEVRSLTN